MMGCVANEVVWAAEAALITHFSCKPSSHGQNLLLISHLPLLAANKRRKTASLAEFRRGRVFADQTKTGQWTQLVKGHLQVELDNLLGPIFFE